MLTIQNKRGTAARLILVNPVLAEGEEVTETDTGRTKTGDGVKTWSQLPYSSGSSLLTRRDFPMRQPYVLASAPATATASTSALTGVDVRSYAPGCFTILGAILRRGTAFPDYTGLQHPAYTLTSFGPWAAEFWLDSADATGRFEIMVKGTGVGYRVAVGQADGSWGYASVGTTFTHASDGGVYYDLVTLGAAGRYKIRLEFAPNQIWFGVRVGATDVITQTSGPAKRYILSGDSFSEPTIVDSGSAAYWDGWGQQLSYLTGLDIWSAAKGGAGYLAGASTARARLTADLAAYIPGATGFISASGINDYGSFTSAQIGTEAAALFAAVKTLNPNIDLVALAPFWPRAITTAPANLLKIRDAIRDAVLAAGGRFLDVLSMPVPSYLGSWSSTLTVAPSVSATSITVASVPTYFASTGGKDGWFVNIGGTNPEVRPVTNVTGTGPYVLSVPALTSAHAIDDVVSLCGPAYMTGTGKQGTTVGDGNADRYTGGDGTHPTRAGHHHIARVVANLWSRSLPA